MPTTNAFMPQFLTDPNLMAQILAMQGGVPPAGARPGGPAVGGPGAAVPGAPVPGAPMGGPGGLPNIGAFIAPQQGPVDYNQFLRPPSVPSPGYLPSVGATNIPAPTPNLRPPQPAAPVLPPVQTMEGALGTPRNPSVGLLAGQGKDSEQPVVPLRERKTTAPTAPRDPRAPNMSQILNPHIGVTPQTRPGTPGVPRKFTSVPKGATTPPAYETMRGQNRAAGKGPQTTAAAEPAAKNGVDQQALAAIAAPAISAMLKPQERMPSGGIVSGGGTDNGAVIAKMLESMLARRA